MKNLVISKTAKVLQYIHKGYLDFRTGFEEGFYEALEKSRK